MGAPGDDLDPAAVLALLPYLHESVMVVRRDWSVSVDLTPPEGILGYGPATGVHPFSLMHPDDVERVAAYAQQAMESEPGWQGSLSARLQRRSGEYANFYVRFHNRLDDPVLQGIVVASRPVGEGGAIADRSSDPMSIELVGDNLPVGLILLSQAGEAIYANAIACDLLDVSLGDLSQGVLPTAIEPVDRREILAIIARLRARPGRETFTCTVHAAEPRLLNATFVSRADESSDGAVRFVIITLEDVTHRLAREQHLEHRANHDSLTGLPNRAWLLDHLHELLAAAQPVLLAFVDLDGFKPVNDRLGHAAGDEVLAACAGGLAKALLPGERVARVGGDEFVVVTSVDIDAEHLRRRLRASIEELGIARHELVGASVGVARSHPGDQPWDLLGRADAAMYQDKRRRS